MQNLTIQILNSQKWRNIHGFRWKRLYIQEKRLFSTYTQHTRLLSFYSHVGNILFPRWELIIPMLGTKIRL